MKVSVKDQGACRKVMTIEVPAEKVAEQQAQAVKEFKKYGSVPGFRKGHAPEKMIRTRYKKEIEEQVRDGLVPVHYREALQETGLEVLTVVDATTPEILDGRPAVFMVTVDVPPVVKLPKYEGIAVKDGAEPIKDERVEEVLEMMRRQQAVYEEVADRPVRKDDMAELTYSATLDGQPLDEVITEAKSLGRGQGWWMMANDESFLTGLGEALVGMAIGETKTVEVTFRDEFVVKELSGKMAEYTVTVTGIREQRLPEMDAEYLARERVESVEALRERTRGYLEEGEDRAEQSRRQNQVIEFLLKKSKLEVPESLVRRQTRNALYDIYRNRLAAGTPRAQVESNMDGLMEEAQEVALDRVKLRFISAAIAAEQGIQASDVEMDEQIARMAVARRVDAARLRKELEEEEESLDDVKAQVLLRKVLDWLLDHAKIK